MKQKFDKNNYEIISNENNKNINIKIKTNISKKDFILEIPIKQKLEHILNFFITLQVKILMII